MNKNLFELAELQLIKEGKEVRPRNVLEYAIKIRKWLDRHKGVGEAILSGREIYQYGNRVILINKQRGYNKFISQPHTNKSYLLEG